MRISNIWWKNLISNENIWIFHHHLVVPHARIFLTLSCHFSLSFIASGRSSGLHSVSSQSCCMYVRAGRPAFARPYVGVHRNTSLMSLSLLLQQCPACLVRHDVDSTPRQVFLKIKIGKSPPSQRFLLLVFFLSIKKKKKKEKIVFVMGGRWPHSWCFVGCCL